MKNSKINEYRENLAKTFLSVLEEKQLDWKKGWTAEKTYWPIPANQLDDLPDLKLEPIDGIAE